MHQLRGIITLYKLACLLFSVFIVMTTAAHEKATYLGNSAVLVESGTSKILFDPFFHNGFGIYQLVPEKLHSSLMHGEAPYDNIDAIIISHAHEDHFSAKDVATYLKRFPAVKLFAPQQAIAELAGESIPEAQLFAFSLDFGDQPVTKTADELIVTGIRIPHAGWPSRKEIENIVFSVKMDGDKVSMHMGDAAPDDQHYLPYKEHWQSNPVNINFPPYWFFMSAEGRDILEKIFKVKKNVGVHVPMQTPKYLKEKQHEYFSEPTSSIKID